MKNRCFQRLLFLLAGAAVIAACLPKGTPGGGTERTASQPRQTAGAAVAAGGAEPEQAAPEAGPARDMPFYTYRDEDGNLQLELYLDPETGQGWGARYVHSGGETEAKAYSFSLNAREDTPPEDAPPVPDKDSVRFCRETDGAELVEDYRESWEYSDDGKPLRFRAQGSSGDPALENPVQVIAVDFFYREDGSLRRKHYWHNAYLMGTTGSPADIFYDVLERPVYAECYITHGGLEYYYLYTGDAREPDCCLYLDFFGEDCLAELYWLSHEWDRAVVPAFSHLFRECTACPPGMGVV